MTTRPFLVALAITLAGGIAALAQDRPEPAAVLTLHVAPNGRDTNDGSPASPFATLERARDEVRRRIAGLPPGGIVVSLHRGAYLLQASFVLSSADSGTREHPILWRAAEGEEARIIGGTAVSGTCFKPVSDPAVVNRLDPAAKGHVVQLDLAALGIRSAKPFPEVFSNGGGLLQLYFNNARMPLSRWPNGGYSTAAEIRDSGVVSGSQRHGGSFVYRGERPERWMASLREDGVWLAGFWRVPWVIQAVKVRAIDPKAHLITQAAPIAGGIGSKYSQLVNGTRKGDGKERYYATNLLEEIDQPGEWCVSFSRQMLYFWPPSALQNGGVTISDLDAPIVKMDNVAHVTLRGLTVEGGLGDAIRITGGEDVAVQGCTVRNTGGNGIVLDGGWRNAVQSCDLYNIGAFGIMLNGGDRKRLYSGGLLAENNHVYRFGEVTKIVSGIRVGGFGNRVANNLIHDSPYGGVLFDGNENIMEFNEIHNIGLDGGDLGAFYANGDWAACCNVIRYNFVHHAPGAQGVYLDDGRSGEEVYGNIAYLAQSAVFMGGGHANVARNNLAVECRYGIHLDARGVARGYNWTKGGALTTTLLRMEYTRPPWSDRYPALATRFTERPEYPDGVAIHNNLLWKCQKPVDLGGKPDQFSKVEVRDNTVAVENPGIRDCQRLDFRLAGAGIPPGFAPIPFEKIGLRTDRFRRVLPTAAETGRNEIHASAPVFDSQVDVDRTNRNQGVKTP